MTQHARTRKRCASCLAQAARLTFGKVRLEDAKEVLVENRCRFGLLQLLRPQCRSVVHRNFLLLSIQGYYLPVVVQVHICRQSLGLHQCACSCDKSGRRSKTMPRKLAHTQLQQCERQDCAPDLETIRHNARECSSSARRSCRCHLAVSSAPPRPTIDGCGPPADHKQE